jgi:hypothetical protein
VRPRFAFGDHAMGRAVYLRDFRELGRMPNCLTLILSLGTIKL